MESDKRGACCLRACVQICLGDAEPQRSAVCVPYLQTTCGTDDEIALRVLRLRPSLPEGADRDINQRRVNGSDVLVGESQFCHPPHRLRLDQKVRVVDKLQKLFAPPLSRDVECDAALVSAVGPPVEGLLRARLVAGERTETPG